MVTLLKKTRSCAIYTAVYDHEIRSYIFKLNLFTKNKMYNIKLLLKIFKRNLTIGFLSTSIISFIIAIIVSKIYVHVFDVFPVIGELGSLDISFFGIILVSRFLIRVLMEYYLEDKYHTALLEGLKEVTSLSMVDNNQSSSNQGTAGQSSSNQNSFKQNYSNDLPNNLDYSAQGRVVLEKHGISITD